MTSQAIEKAYKVTEEGISVYADIIIPSKASEHQQTLPVLVWWHGGGLLQGTRKGTAPHLQKAPEERNIIVVSADYRLAPQVRMPAILSDVGDLLRWIDSNEFAELTNNKADRKKVFVSGSSAGGWLALLAASGLGFQECGLLAPPKPLGCIGIYPISDLLDPFWNTKQHPVTYFPRIIDGEKELGKNLDPKSEVLMYSTLDDPRSVFYHYMIQEALLPFLLLDGTRIKSQVFSVAQAISRGAIQLPLTLLTHGSIDDKVPPRRSIDVYSAAKSKGLKDIELVIEEGKDHLYDRDPSIDMAVMYDFIKKHSTA